MDVISGEEKGGERGKKVQGISSINGRYKIDGEVKNSIGNVGDKELICTTHGHELRWGGMLEGRGYKAEGDKKLGTIGITVIA